MSNIYFISDIHLDDKFINLNSRHWKSLEGYKNTIINNWNSVVSEDDIVFDLGDISINNNTDNIRSFLSKLKGTKYLIKGNHDTLPNEAYIGLGYSYVYDYPVIIDDFYILSHKPMYVIENSPYVNIYGHVHDNTSYKTVSERSYCVCPERNNYTPVKFDQIKYDISEYIDSKNNEISIVSALDKNGDIIYYEVKKDGKKTRVSKEYVKSIYDGGMI